MEKSDTENIKKSNNEDEVNDDQEEKVLRKPVKRKTGSNQLNSITTKLENEEN